MTNQSQIKEPDDLRFIANHPVFFMQRLVMCGKEERKGGLVGGLVFGGTGRSQESTFCP